MKAELGGLKSIGRQVLGKLFQASKESFTVVEASQILNVSRYRAACLLCGREMAGFIVFAGDYTFPSLYKLLPQKSLPKNLG
jgi:hypothetical protein